MKKNFKIKLIILFALIFWGGQHAWASSLDLNIGKNTFKENEFFTLTLSLNTEGKPINAIEGDLQYNENFIKAENVNIGNSFVSFWVEQPNLKVPGLVHFSGITPGGVSGTEDEVFKIVFKTEKPGETSLSLKNTKLFLNDGNGTAVPVTLEDLNINISQGESTNTILDAISLDKISPEKFTITRTKDKSIFDNKYFIVFSTTDKGTGIDHYKVCELFKCVTAESPYMLWNQTPFYFITVNAYDMNGNSTSSTVISPYFALLFVLVLFGTIFFLYRRYLRSNKV